MISQVNEASVLHVLIQVKDTATAVVYLFMLLYLYRVVLRQVQIERNLLLQVVECEGVG